MAKEPEVKEAATPTGVSVKLKCVYSGAEGDPGPGDVITVDADEAARLISLGAAEACEAPAVEGGAQE